LFKWPPQFDFKLVRLGSADSIFLGNSLTVSLDVRQKESGDYVSMTVEMKSGVDRRGLFTRVL
jgi:hypothetical protein